MAAANRTEPLSSLADCTSAHTARMASVHAVRDAELAELDRARTRAEVAHTKAIDAVEAEHAAALLDRHAAVVAETLEVFRGSLRALDSSQSPRIVGSIVDRFRVREAEHLRVLGAPLKDELGVAAVEEYLEKHPAALGRLANPDSWVRLFGDGISTAASRASEVLRQGFDVRAVLDNLQALSTLVARIAMAPGFSAVDAADAEVLWEIRRLCLPGDQAEERYQAHVRAVKTKQIAAAQAELDEQYRALNGDRDALRSIRARGTDAFANLRDGMVSIIHRVSGRVPLAQDLNTYNDNLKPEA